MKKILLLIALIMVFYYAKAHALNEKEWKECANKAARPAIIQSNEDNDKFVKNVCDFYGKPMNECIPIIANATDEELNQILTSYLLHGVIIPACGTPGEDN